MTLRSLATTALVNPAATQFAGGLTMGDPRAIPYFNAAGNAHVTDPAFVAGEVAPLALGAVAQLMDRRLVGGLGALHSLGEWSGNGYATDTPGGAFVAYLANYLGALGPADVAWSSQSGSAFRLIQVLAGVMSEFFEADAVGLRLRDDAGGLTFEADRASGLLTMLALAAQTLQIAPAAPASGALRVNDTHPGVPGTPQVHDDRLDAGGTLAPVHRIGSWEGAGDPASVATGGLEQYGPNLAADPQDLTHAAVSYLSQASVILRQIVAGVDYRAAVLDFLGLVLREATAGGQTVNLDATTGNADFAGQVRASSSATGDPLAVGVLAVDGLGPGGAPQVQDARMDAGALLASIHRQGAWEGDGDLASVPSGGRRQYGPNSAADPQDLTHAAISTLDHHSLTLRQALGGIGLDYLAALLSEAGLTLREPVTGVQTVNLNATSGVGTLIGAILEKFQIEVAGSPGALICNQTGPGGAPQLVDDRLDVLGTLGAIHRQGAWEGDGDLASVPSGGRRQYGPNSAADPQDLTHAAISTLDHHSLTLRQALGGIGLDYLAALLSEAGLTLREPITGAVSLQMDSATGQATGSAWRGAVEMGGAGLGQISGSAADPTGALPGLVGDLYSHRAGAAGDKTALKTRNAVPGVADVDAWGGLVANAGAPQYQQFLISGVPTALDFFTINPNDGSGARRYEWNAANPPLGGTAGSVWLYVGLNVAESIAVMEAALDNAADARIAYPVGWVAPRISSAAMPAASLAALAFETTQTAGDGIMRPEAQQFTLAATMTIPGDDWLGQWTIGADNQQRAVIPITRNISAAEAAGAGVVVRATLPVVGAWAWADIAGVQVPATWVVDGQFVTFQVLGAVGGETLIGLIWG